MTVNIWQIEEDLPFVESWGIFQTLLLGRVKEAIVPAGPGGVPRTDLFTPQHFARLFAEAIRQKKPFRRLLHAK